MIPRPLSALAAGAEVPHAPALVTGDRVFSYAELAHRVARAAGAIESFRLAPGDRLALRATNRPETVTAMLASIELGVPFLAVHPRLTDGEADALYRDAAPARVLGDADIDALGAGAPGRPHAEGAPPNPAGPLAILYTSGTSGHPKGAVLARSAFLASASASAANLGWRAGDRWLVCMPLCHTGGLSILTRCLAARQAVVLLPAFQPEAVLSAVARSRVTLMSVVPTMLKALLAADSTNVLAGVRAILVGGAPASPALLEACAERRVTALATYGLTEACSQVTAQSPSDPGRSTRGSGRPLPSVELLVAGDDGAALSPGVVGRLLLRGPMRMSGYLGQAPLAPGEWFDTGDLGALDDQGELHVHARRTDLIVTGGENVYPAEIELAIEACPGVARALVFGVPDDAWGQLVAAAVVLGPAAGDLGSVRAALLAELGARLAPHKRPRLVCFPRELPYLPPGKLDRRGALRRFGGELTAWA